MAIGKATPADMLSVQLDDSALFHERWRTLLLATLTPAVVQGHAARAEFCRRLGRTAEARQAYERALTLSKQEAERRFLQRRLTELS